MRFTENRPVAWAVLAVCVLGSIVGFGGGSVAKDRADLIDLFNRGTNAGSTTIESMDAYLDKSANQASVMANEALMLLGNDNAVAQEMLSLVDTVSSGSDLDARYEAYLTLQKDSDALYNVIYEQFDNAQKKNFKMAYDDFWEQEKFIKRDEYRSKAAEFNNELKGFPADLITSIRGVKQLNSFGAD